MPLTLRGRTLDMTGALPLTIGDWKALQKQGVTYARAKQGIEDPEAFAIYALYVLRKANPEVTAADVDAMTFVEAAKFLEAAIPPEDPEARPTSTPATSSGSSTAGAPATSPA